MMKVAIVGLGLIGGSLGLCLKENKFISCVLGYDIDKENANLALKLGLIHELMSEFNPQELANCDIVVLATPVDAIVSLVKELENLPQSTTLIELGSTKTKIVKATPKALKPHIIYAHPMCGTENSGASAAFKELYSGAVCVLCDSETADDTHQKRAVEIFSHLGMKIVFMDSTSHDHHAAIISHLPHAISFALANFVMKEEDKKDIVHLAGGSFRGMSRIAKSSPAMWESIFTQNKNNLISSIEHFQKELEFCKQMIANNDENALKSWMSKANTLREIL